MKGIHDRFGQMPRPSAVNADDGHRIPSRVKGSKHVGSSDAADLMFGRSAAKQNHNMDRVEIDRVGRRFRHEGTISVLLRLNQSFTHQAQQLRSQDMAVQPVEDGKPGSEPGFLTHHALRIKGFAPTDMLVEMVSLEFDVVQGKLHDLASSGLAVFREARSLWQLTPDGRQAHLEALARDVQNFDLEALKPHYRSFLGINDAFKTLCGDWQLREGAPNDHSDVKYDQAVIDRLQRLHDQTQPVVSEMAAEVPRLNPYGRRLEQAVIQVAQGAVTMFTGVMCGSFHDIWMELHEDLILTQGIDRAAEGSF